MEISSDGFFNRLMAVTEFTNVCQPFRALLYGMLLSWYDLSVRDRHAGEKFRADRNDMFMSVYLPYCDQFVTQRKKGEQEKCLREIVKLAGLETQVLSYDDFCNRFLVSRTSLSQTGDCNPTILDYLRRSA